jgi:acetyltransferase-like isoleucine patch superfamily enzyme
VKTGIGVLLMPGVKVGNGSWVGAGLVVERDVASSTMVKLKQASEETKLQ